LLAVLLPIRWERDRGFPAFGPGSARASFAAAIPPGQVSSESTPWATADRVARAPSPG
jgi:hypothetical protein